MKTVYEVLRILERRPVFLTEHLKRLQGSLEFYGIQGVSIEDIEAKVKELAKTDERANFNIRIDVKDDSTVTMKAVDGIYPTETMRKGGVKIIIFDYKRENPNIKTWNQELKDEIEDLRQTHNVFEIVYIDNERVLEGSRSNVFFVKDGKIITCPDEEVLLGVTRMKVLETCEEEGIEVEKREVFTDELETMDGAFLTGTSINMLPIKRFDEWTYKVDTPLFIKLRDAFEKKVLTEN
ncbi:aminotransferase class IV [Guggenheimella bovis]